MNLTRLASQSVVVLHAILVMSCDKGEKAGTTQTSAANPQPETTTHAAAEPKTQAPMIQPMATVGKPTVTWKGVGLSTPESVLHDEAADEYLVSNIEGQPLDVDGKAFISRLKPDGSVATLKWIEGGKNKVTLNSPKGMALMGDMLYVADIDTVRIFDRKSGAPMGEVKVPGATDLNDAAMGPDGRVLVSDTGTKRTPKGYEPGGADAVYAIDKEKKLTTIAKSRDLGGPNGLAPAGDKTWVATVRTGELYSIDAKGKKGDAQKLPKGGLDGIVLYDGELVISSWDASTIFRGRAGGEMKPFIQDVPAPADIGYDKKRARLLVPLFNENEVRAYDLKER